MTARLRAAPAQPGGAADNRDQLVAPARAAPPAVLPAAGPAALPAPRQVVLQAQAPEGPRLAARAAVGRAMPRQEPLGLGRLEPPGPAQAPRVRRAAARVARAPRMRG